jgi:hypothetical protein
MNPLRGHARALRALIAITLLLQVFAPGVAAKMLAARLSPSAGAVICTRAGPHRGHPPGQPDRDDCGSNCPICAAAAQMAVIEPEPRLSPSGLFAHLDMPIARPAAVVGAVRLRPKARGPPGEA